MRTQSKIALILFSSYVLVLLVFGGSIYYFQNKYSYTDFYKRLQTRASIAVKYNLEADRLNAETILNIRQQHLEKLPEEQEYLFEVQSADDIPVWASTYSLPPEFLRQVYEAGKADYKGGTRFYSGIIYKQHDKKYMVIISAHNYYFSHHLSFLKNIIWTGIALIALITIGFSVYFSKLIFHPISQITDKVRRISTESMHLRLEEPGTKNEIGELILTFNDLLNRIETAFETHNNFVSNASHEIGTPLTAIMGEAEVALTKERQPAEYQEVLQNILQQAERLDQITRSLLFLAQTGYEGKKIAFDVLRIDEVIWSVKEVMDRLNPQNKIYINLDLLPEDPKKLKIRGNKELLNLAIANLLSNACKYSHNRPVALSIAASNADVIIVIRDEGVGIPENEIQYIYDPFFRASNTHSFEGYGIGLPLTRNIIKLHSGTLHVNSQVNTGTSVRINFPLVKII
jgi:signal transduction histidine kinase